MFFLNDRFNIQFKVSDKSGQVIFVLFDKKAKKLFQCPTTHLSRKIGQESDDVPSQIQRLCGSIFVFKIKFTNFNLKEVGRSYNITKMFKINQKLKNKYRSQETCKVFLNKKNKKLCFYGAQTWSSEIIIDFNLTNAYFHNHNRKQLEYF